MINKTILGLAFSLYMLGLILFVIPMLEPLNFLPLLGFLFYSAGTIWVFNCISKEDNTNFHETVKEIKEEPPVKEVNILDGVI